jgi:hypothetical protein
MERIIKEDHIIIDKFNGKIIDKICRFKGHEKNKYWFVLNIITNEEYYLIECCGDRLTKVDEESIDKILTLNKTLTICNNYVVIENGNDSKIALHAFLMNHFGNGKGQDSVDHINQDKLDNRLCNLRITTQSVQNSNRPYERNKNSKFNKNKPIGMEHIERLPRHVEYNTEERKNKEKNTTREFFILKHSKCPIYGKYNMIVSSKSNSLTAIDKYNFILEKMKELDIEIKYS